MALYLGLPADLANLPVGTEYRVIAERPDLFAGKVLVETRAALAVTGFSAGPKAYANGVDVLAGCGIEWRKAEAPKDPLAGVADADVLAAAKLRGLKLDAQAVSLGE